MLGFFFFKHLTVCFIVGTLPLSEVQDVNRNMKSVLGNGSSSFNQNWNW